MQAPSSTGRLGALAIGLGWGIALMAGSAVAAADPAESAAGPAATSDSPSVTKSATQAAKAKPKTEAKRAEKRETKSSTSGKPRTAAAVAEPKAGATAGAESDEPGAVEDSIPAKKQVMTSHRRSTEVKTAAATVSASPVSAAAPSTAATLQAPATPAVQFNDFVAKVALTLGYASIEGNDASGGLPALDNLLGQVAAGWRRVLDPEAPNLTPTAGPSQNYQFDTGEVIGDLHGWDIDGDKLTYTVTQGPAKGEVFVNSNGTYQYRPDGDFKTVGGADSFTVTIHDGINAPTSVVVPVSVTPTLGRSRGYAIDVLLPDDGVTIMGVGGDASDYHGPGKGTVINGITRINYQVDEYLFARTETYVELQTSKGYTQDSGANFVVWAVVPASSDSDQPSSMCITGGRGRGACGGGGQNIQLLSEKVETITVDADDPVQALQIGELVQKYCFDGSAANCTIRATNQVRTVGLEHQIGASVSNPNPAGSPQVTSSITISDAIAETDNVQISVKASGGTLTNILSLINLEISGTYGHTWQKTHTFSQTVGFAVNPGWTQTAYAADPVYRVTGNFTIKVGNTTLLLNNAKFDTPRDDNQQPGAAIVVRNTPYVGTESA